MCCDKLSTLRAKQGRYEESLAFIHELEAHGGKASNVDPVIYKNLGHMQHQTDNLEKAQEQYDKATDGKELSGDDKWNIGILKKDQGDLDGAIKLLTEALQWFQDSQQNKIMTGKVHQDLARTQAKRGDYDMAKTHFEKTQELFAESGGSNYTLTGNVTKEFGEML